MFEVEKQHGSQSMRNGTWMEKMIANGKNTNKLHKKVIKARQLRIRQKVKRNQQLHLIVALQHYRGQK